MRPDFFRWYFQVGHYCWKARFHASFWWSSFHSFHLYYSGMYFLHWIVDFMPVFGDLVIEYYRQDYPILTTIWFMCFSINRFLACKIIVVSCMKQYVENYTNQQFAVCFCQGWWLLRNEVELSRLVGLTNICIFVIGYCLSPEYVIVLYLPRTCFLHSDLIYHTSYHTVHSYLVFRGANKQKHVFKKDPKAPIWGKPPKVVGGKLLASGYW